MSVRIHPRAEAGLGAPTSRVLMARSNGNHIHWNGGPVPEEVRRGDLDAVKSYLRSTQRFHQGPQRRWADIGYNFAVDGAGRIWELRGWMVVGAHAPGFNSTSHGLLLILGEGQTPTPAMLAGARAYIAEHNRRCGKGYIRPHSAAKATQCPGDHIRSLIARGELDPAKAAPGPAAAPAPAIDYAALRRWIAGVSAHNLAKAGTLRRGSKGGAVGALQDGLNVAAGANLKVDRDFGPATETAVRNFQRFFKLTVDGVAGPQTKGMLIYCLHLIRDGKA